MGTNSTHSLLPVVAFIEEAMVRYYGLSTGTVKANQHLLPPTSTRPSETLFSQENGEIFIGIHLDAGIVGAIEQESPLVQLSSHNLDPFLVVVEEVSHFHLLLDRFQRGTHTSHLELEWQAEVDKLLLGAMVCQAQYGEAFLPALMASIYEGCVYLGTHPERYLAANKYAARFWLDALQHGIQNMTAIQRDPFKSLMQFNYKAPLGQKASWSSRRVFLP